MVPRAQSSAVGTMLLVGLVVVGVGVAAVFGAGILLDGSQNLEKRSLAVSADVRNTTDGHELVVTHVDGAGVPPADLAIVVGDAGAGTRVPLESFDLDGVGDGQFDPGDTATLSRSFTGDEVELRVVDEGTQTMVQTLTVAVPNGVGGWLDFSETSPEPFESNQDKQGGATVTDGGKTLVMEGNTWKRVPFDGTLTEDTVIRFEYRSTSEGEIHGIGLENDNRQTSGRVFKVFGTQNWGDPTYDDYQTGDGWKTYTIPIGEIYADKGYAMEADYLVFVNDCDCPDPDANSQFRDVTVYNDSG